MTALLRARLPRTEAARAPVSFGANDEATSAPCAAISEKISLRSSTATPARTRARTVWFRPSTRTPVTAMSGAAGGDAGRLGGAGPLDLGGHARGVRGVRL